MNDLSQEALEKLDLRVLEQFNKRANRLIESRFSNWLHAKKKRPNLDRISAGEWLAYEGLHPDDVDAYNLNLRLLLQDRDGFSLRCLESMYDRAGDEWEPASAMVRKERNTLNNFLSQKSFIQFGDRQITNSDFFETIFYGGLVHADRKYEPSFERLTSGWRGFSVFTFSYYSAVLQETKKTGSGLAKPNEEDGVRSCKTTFPRLS